MESGRIPLSTPVLALAAVVLVELLAGLVREITGLPDLVVLGGARLTDLFLMLKIVKRRGLGLECIGIDPSRAASGLKRGLSWSAGFAFAAALGGGGLYLFGMNPLEMIHVELPADASRIALYFLVGGLLGPAAEEVFFRGIVFGFFRRWGAASALVFSTVFFVMAHRAAMPMPVTQAVGGVVFALAYEREKSLLVPFTLHALGNMAIFALSLLSINYFPAPDLPAG